MFSDTFDTLSLSNYVSGASGTWQLGGRSFTALGFSPGGGVDGVAWNTSPFNPNTAGVYLANLVPPNGVQLEVIQTPQNLITACGGQAYEAAWMSTRSNNAANGFTTGYFEASIAFHMIAGTTATFWMLGDADTQIDIVEADFNPPSGGGLFYNHNIFQINPVSALSSFYQYDGTSSSGGSGSFSGALNMGNFNTYGVNITASSVQFYFNRTLTEQLPTPTGYGPGGQPLYLILSMQANPSDNATGTITSPTSLPATMTVQYVKAWATRPF